MCSVDVLWSSPMGPGNLGQWIADTVRAASGAGVAALYRCEPPSDQPVLQAASGPGALGFAAAALSPPGRSVIELTVRSDQPFVTTDLLADSRLSLSPEDRARAARVEHRAVFCARLSVDDTIAGVLALGYPAGDRLEDRRTALEALSGHAAIAMYGAWLCEEAHRRQQETAALEEVT